MWNGGSVVYLLMYYRVMATTSANLVMNVRANTAGAKKAFGGLSAAAGVALAGITVGLKKVTDAYGKQEQVEAKLVNMARNRGITDRASIQSFKDQASALQKVGVIGDEVTLSGQATLLTFEGMSKEIVQKLTPGLLDMAAQTKGAKATQEDLMNIANLVGRSFTGYTGTLSRYGIVMTEAERETIKNGNRDGTGECTREIAGKKLRRRQ